MKKFTIFLLSILLLLIGGLMPLAAQNCSLFTGSGGDIFPDKRCAPVGVTFQARFFSPAGPDVLQDIKIRVDWADGSPAETFAPTATSKINADGSTTWTYEIKNITHTYPEGGTKCNYEVYARPVINGMVCNSYFYKGNVTVWDKDNANGGQIATNPQYYFVCPGEEFSLTFNDVSVWNCTPPLETDNINWPARWTQYIYGTNTTAGPRISGIEVDGGVKPSPYRGNIKPHIDWQLGPDHTSLVVKVPATAQVGELYEITLRNWNTCNPYDDPALAGGPANAQDGDYAPVTNVAIIKIVDRPTGTITTRNKNNTITDNFCPAERVRFEGQQTVAGITNVQYDWYIYDDATGTNLLEEKRNARSWNMEGGFPTAGQKKIVLRIRNKDAANACWGEISKIINVYAAPSVAPELNGVAGSQASICWSGSSEAMNFGFRLMSANNYKYQISLYKRNSTALAPDSTVFGEQNVAGGQGITASHNASLMKPGVYKVQLLATDRITGCSTLQTSEVVLLAKPVAAFSFPNVCAGMPVTFTDASTLPVSINGDLIKTWEWDVDYNGSSYTFDYTGKDPFDHTYAAAGTYKVALVLTTENGCQSTLVKTIQVKPVPIATLAYNYTQPICPGEPVIFSNTSANDLSQFPEGLTYTLVVEEGGVVVRHAFTDATRQLTFSNATAALKTYTIWLEAKANNPNNCSTNSTPLQVVVKPGAMAGFVAQGYDPMGTHCSPQNLLLEVNQATRDIDADRYTWTIMQGNVEVKKIVQLKGNADFGNVSYAATNTTSSSITYTVRLVAEKSNKCITPAEERYRVNPVPVSAFTVKQLSQSCEETVLEVQVTNPSGIKKYNWTIFPDPDNMTSVVYGEKFQLVYKRPTITAPSYEVDLSLVTENFFDCPSPATAKKASILPQQLDDVKVVVISASNTGCSPLPVEFQNQTKNPPAGTQYTVMMRHGSLPEQELIPASGSAAGKFTYTFMREGNYQIWLKAVAPDGCVRYQTVPAQVVVYPNPKPYFSVDTKEGCGPLTVSLNKANITGAKRSWQVTDLSNSQLVYGPAIFDPASTDNFSYITLQNTGVASKQYRISLSTESAEGCKADSSLVVTVFPEPKALFEVIGGTNICEPYTIEVKNTSTNPTGTTYTWEWGDGTSTSSTNTSLTKTYTNSSYSSTLNFPVRLIARTPNGCTAEFVVNVSVAPRVLADFDLDRQSGCSPLQLNITNRSRGNTDAASGWYIRRPGNATFDAMGNTLTSHTFTNTSNATVVYELRYVAANAAGCTSQLTREITVHPQVQPQVAADVTEGCGPLTVTLQNLAVQQNVRYTWQWGDGSPDDVTTDARSIVHRFDNTSAATPRRFVVKVVAENTITTCATTLSQEIVVYPQIIANVQPNITKGCSPLQLSFQNNSQNAQTHSWRIIRKDTGAEVFASTDQTPTISELTNTGTASLVYEVIYKARSTQDCPAEQKHEITVYPAVTAEFAVNKNADCAPATFTFTNNHVQTGVTYTWQWGDGSADEQSTASILTHKFENASNSLERKYMVRLIATNTATNCSSSFSHEVLVYPQVVASVVPNKTNGCAPLELMFQNNSQNADTHSWNIFRKDTGEEVFASNDRTPNIPLLNNAGTSALVYVVRYTARSARNCDNQQLHEITVNPGAAAAFSMNINGAVCGKTPVIFTNSNVQAGVEYTWQWGDGSPNTITTTETEVAHTFTNEGTGQSRFFEVTLSAVNPAYRCTSVFRQTVTVYPSISVAVTPNKDVICAPDEVRFTNRSQNASTHEWWYRLQGTSEKLEVRNSAEVVYQFSNTSSEVQVYEVVYVGTSSNGCSDKAINTITVYPALEPYFTVDSEQLNLPDAVVNITNITPHADAWITSWSFGGDASSSEVHPGSRRYNAYGTYTITLTISNGRCSKSYSREIKVGDTPPIVDFESQPVAGCAPLPVQFNNTSQYTDPNSYYWDFGDGKGFSTAESPSYTYLKAGQYEVTLTARNRTGETRTMTKKMVTVYEVPKADFTVRQTVVFVPGDAVYVSNYSEGGGIYLWDFGDGTTYTDKNPVHYYQQPGIYTITLTVSNKWGCSDTITLKEVVTAEAGGKIKIPNAFTPDLGGPNSGGIDAGNNDVFFPVLEGGINKYNMRIYNRWGELMFETTNRSIGWNGYYKGRLCKSDVYAYKIYVEFSDGKTLQQIGDVTLIR